jgi:hypothetical protein
MPTNLVSSVVTGRDDDQHGDPYLPSVTGGFWASKKRWIPLFGASVALEIILTQWLAEVAPVAAGAEVVHQAQISQ